MSEALLSAVPEFPMLHIDEKGFYQTPNVMTIKAIRAKLTGADWALWEYFKMFDPHGDKMVDLPSVKEISEALDISTRQIKRSLKKLEDLGLYDSEPVTIRGQNLAGKLAKQICQEKKQSKSSSKNKMTDLALTRQSRPINDEPVQPMTDLSSNRQDCPTQPPQPAPSKDSVIPQTNTDYSDLIKTTTNTAVVVAEENKPEEEEPTPQPTNQQVNEAIAEMQRIWPAIKDNPTVRKHLIRYWANFPAAREAVKTALQDGKLKNPTGFFVSQLKQPPTASESPAIQTRNFPPIPTKKQKEELATLGNVYERNIFDQRYPSVWCTHVKINGNFVLWWEALGLKLEDLPIDD